MLAGLEPFATWYYLFAWYPTLIVIDAAAALRAGRFPLLGRPLHLLTLLGWSAVLWLFFELLNFRLENWHYVYVPREPALRWMGILLSFATVLPAILGGEALLDAYGVGRRLRTAPLAVTPARLRVLIAAGVAALALPLVLPELFFPLVWVALTLAFDPLVYRRDPARSLLGDLERGRPGRIVRLLLAGAAAGLLWELYNVRARAKWIYTVPGFEDLKLFEMPVLGFLGFPPFALECFVVWQALVLAGLAVPREGTVRAVPRRRRLAAAVAAIVFCGAVVLGVEAKTISSYEPRLADLPDIPVRSVESLGYDVFSLARSRPEEVASRSGSDPVRARSWIDTARVAALRGIGAQNVRRLRAAGVGSLEELAAADPEELALRLERVGGRDVHPRLVRVWVHAARTQVKAGRG